MTKNIIKLAKEVAIIFGLDYSEESLKQASEFIDWIVEQDEYDAEHFIDLLGSFFGECLATNFEGVWTVHEGEVCIKIADMIIYPFHKVAKQFANGEVDSIYSLYNFIETFRDRLGGELS